MRYLFGFAVLAALLTCVTACSRSTDNGQRNTSEGPRSEPVQQATGAPEPAVEDDAGAPPAARDYVALGDSLAVGIGARRGYVHRYAGYLREDTDARVELTNLGVSGQTSSQLLRARRTETSMRRALRGAEVVTYNIGINDLGRARGSYEAGTCGGARGERCLRAAVQKFEANWDGISEEILNLRSPNETVIRTAGLGYTPQAGRVFEPYLEQANRHIARRPPRTASPTPMSASVTRASAPTGCTPTTAATGRSPTGCESWDTNRYKPGAEGGDGADPLRRAFPPGREPERARRRRSSAP